MHRMGGPDLPIRGSDQRKHPRYAYAAAGTAWCRVRFQAQSFAVTAGNIGLGGMMLQAFADPAEALRCGDELILGFPDPVSKKQVKLKARVKWKRPGVMNLLGGEAIVRFGLEFHDTPESDIRKLHDPLAGMEEASS